MNTQTPEKRQIQISSLVELLTRQIPPQADKNVVLQGKLDAAADHARRNPEIWKGERELLFRLQDLMRSGLTAEQILLRNNEGLV